MRATRIAKGFQAHACHNKCNNANDTTDVVARIARIRQTKSCNRQDQKYHRPRHLTAVPFPELLEIGFHNLSYLSCISCSLWLKSCLYPILWIRHRYSLVKFICYFRYFLLSTSDKMRICWMAISLSFFKRCGWGTLSFIMTAFIFSMLEMQIS